MLWRHKSIALSTTKQWVLTSKAMRCNLQGITRQALEFCDRGNKT